MCSNGNKIWVSNTWVMEIGHSTSISTLCSRGTCWMAFCYFCKVGGYLVLVPQSPWSQTVSLVSTSLPQSPRSSFVLFSLLGSHGLFHRSPWSPLVTTPFFQSLLVSTGLYWSPSVSQVSNRLHQSLRYLMLVSPVPLASNFLWVSLVLMAFPISIGLPQSVLSALYGYPLGLSGF